MRIVNMNLVRTEPKPNPAALLWGLEGLQGQRPPPLPSALQRAIVVDPDIEAAEPVCTYLGGAGFSVRRVDSGGELFPMLAESDPDLVVLSLNLFGENAVRVCAKARSLSAAALVLVATPRRRHTALLGLESGADDYLVRPFLARELLARVQAILRRRSPQSHLTHAATAQSHPCYHFGPYTLSTARRELVKASHGAIKLTGGEFRLLSTLLAARGEVVPFDRIAQAGSRRSAAAHSIASSIYQLRSKLDQGDGRGSVIGSVRGVGYVIKVRIAITHE
jgi:DNA-binding response OmpR family regulator